MARDNRTLGRFHLDGIPTAPRGVPQIEVTFDIDANGIVKVSAVDKATNKEQQITITASSGLDDREIDRMVNEAERHADEDKQQREKIELRNRADSLVYTTERTLKEHGAKVPAAEKQRVEEAIEKTKEAIKADDADRIRASLDELTAASHKLAEIMYREASGGAQPGGGPGDGGQQPGGGNGGASKDEVIDAEYD
jgi:molecular chaperone DnaK